MVFFPTLRKVKPDGVVYSLQHQEAEAKGLCSWYQSGVHKQDPFSETNHTKKIRTGKWINNLSGKDLSKNCMLGNQKKWTKLKYKTKNGS